MVKFTVEKTSISKTWFSKCYVSMSICLTFRFYLYHKCDPLSQNLPDSRFLPANFHINSFTKTFIKNKGVCQWHDFFQKAHDKNQIFLFKNQGSVYALFKMMSDSTFLSTLLKTSAFWSIPSDSKSWKLYLNLSWSPMWSWRQL